MIKLENFINEMSEKFKNVKTVEELNTTGNVDGYNTPNAFCDCDDIDDDNCSCNNTTDKMSPYKEHMVNEINYTEFKNDKSLNTKQKINNEIKKINSSLFELNRIVKRCSKLKTETGADESVLWKSSRTKLHKIRERLIKISKNIMELGS